MDITEIEDLLCDEAVEEICQCGCNEEAVKKWVNYYLHDLGLLNICPFKCKELVESYGFDDYVENKIEYMQRAIWIAAWNIKDRNEVMQ